MNFSKPLQLRSEDHRPRQATWLELFFDLAFVICISALSHRLNDQPTWEGILTYVSFFVPVWWIWNQFTWYASHFDNDDVWYRMFMLSGVGGTIVLQGSLHNNDLKRFIISYIALHILLFMAWFRVYRHIPEYRSYSALKLFGVSLGLLFWFAGLFQTRGLTVVLMGSGLALQLMLPIIAWQTVRATISVHAHHLFERHGLFTIIVLGETLIAIAAFASDPNTALIPEAVALFITLVGMWWLYFDWDYDPLNLNHTGKAFAYNYGQLLIYASLGIFATGTGLTLRNNGANAALVLIGVTTYLGSLSLTNLLSGRGSWTQVMRLYLLPMALVTCISLAISLNAGGTELSSRFAILAVAAVIVFTVISQIQLKCKGPLR